MNEEALQAAYNLFKSDGYSDSIEDFNLLINSNEEALQAAYNLFKSDGYSDSIEDFSSLLRVGQLKKRKFKGYFSRGRYGFTYTSTNGRTYLCGIFCSRK
jgi:hypothetical protein